MALGQRQTFRTRNPGQRCFLDLPQEVKNNVYQKYFEDQERHFELDVYFRDGHYVAYSRRGRLQGPTWIPASPHASARSLLSTCRAIYTESLLHLYDGTVFMLPHSALVSLPLDVKARIRHLDTSGMHLAGIIGRGDAPRSSIWLHEIWGDILHQLGRLESLTFDCHPQFILKLGAQTQIDPIILLSDSQVAEGGYRFYIPPVKKIIITSGITVNERIFIEGLDLHTHKLWYLGNKIV